MPVGYGVGDHRMFVIDFLTSSLIGCNPLKIVRAAARRLNTAIPGVEDKYVTMLEDLMEHHRLVPKVQGLLSASRPEIELKMGLEALDEEMRQYMHAAEKKCRRIKSGRIPFSPEASKWIRRAQVYRSLLRLHAGKIRNRGNLKRAARRCGVEHPMNMSLTEIRSRLKVCKDKCNYFKKHGHRHRRRHLKSRLEKAKEKRMKKQRSASCA